MSTPDNPTDDRRKRLRFRSWHRGTREMDLLLGRFADRYLQAFSGPQLDLYETMLERSDTDLYECIAGRAVVPPELDHDVMKLLINFKFKS